MDIVETVALVRDIVLIVVFLVGLVVLVIVGYMLLRLYPSVKRTTFYLEESAGRIHGVITQPLSIFGAVVELINRGLGMVSQIRNREKRDEDDEE